MAAREYLAPAAWRDGLRPLLEAAMAKGVGTEPGSANAASDLTPHQMLAYSANAEEALLAVFEAAVEHDNERWQLDWGGSAGLANFISRIAAASPTPVTGLRYTRNQQFSFRAGLATLRRINLKQARLSNCCFLGADLEGASFEGARLGNADLRDANLKHADLSEASLGGADLRGANLEKASLWEATLTDTVLIDANLRSANLSTAQVGGADLRGANLDGAFIDNASFQGANLEGANLENARWDKDTRWPDGFSPPARS